MDENEIDNSVLLALLRHADAPRGSLGREDSMAELVLRDSTLAA